jgi:flagellar basal body-associated protein FliL
MPAEREEITQVQRPRKGGLLFFMLALGVGGVLAYTIGSGVTGSAEKGPKESAVNPVVDIYAEVFKVNLDRIDCTFFIPIAPNEEDIRLLSIEPVIYINDRVQDVEAVKHAIEKRKDKLRDMVRELLREIGYKKLRSIGPSKELKRDIMVLINNFFGAEVVQEVVINDAAGF